jgi:uncharacterized lipoprotein YddW (UPF0748 family)
MKKILLLLAAALLAAACSDDDNDSPTTPDEEPDSTETVVTELKPRFIWVDAAANFPRFANSKENIREDLQKAKDAGFTDVVVDVRPSMGDVLFNTSLTEQVKKLDVWEGSSYTYCERTATWDYLQAFIDIGHELGLKVDAAFNTFTGGCLYPYGLGQQGAVFRDADKRSWVTVLNLEQGYTNELDLTSTDPQDDLFYGTKFLNPCDDEVQTYLLGMLRDLAQYDLDGIFLDRCRFDDLRADFSEITQRKFKEYLGVSELDFATDVMPAGAQSLPTVQPRYLKDWLAFRAKTIYDFVAKAVATIHGVNRNIRVGTYVGAWYSTYYDVGVNWASRKYNTAAHYPEWANADYSKYGYAGLLDYMLLGCYASASSVYGSGEWTMQGFCTQGRELLAGDVKFAGGPDVGNATGFTEGNAAEAVTQSVDACINAADGYFVFDMVHVREYNYWDALKKGIDAYLEKNK